MDFSTQPHSELQLSTKDFITKHDEPPDNLFDKILDFL